MKDLFEKSIDLGLGFYMYSREKAEEFVEELVNKGEVARKDARKFTTELVKRGEEQRNELKKIINDGVTETLKQINVANKEDIVTKDEIRQIVREQITQALQEQRTTKMKAVPNQKN